MQLFRWREKATILQSDDKSIRAECTWKVAYVPASTSGQLAGRNLLSFPRITGSTLPLQFQMAATMDGAPTIASDREVAALFRWPIRLKPCVGLLVVIVEVGPTSAAHDAGCAGTRFSQWTNLGLHQALRAGSRRRPLNIPRDIRDAATLTLGESH